MSNEEPWDKESVYDEQISPLISKVIAICTEHGIPYLSSFLLNSEGLNCTTSLLGSERAPKNYREALHLLIPARTRPVVTAEIVVTDPMTGMKTIHRHRIE